jgi:hypothetical protein
LAEWRGAPGRAPSLVLPTIAAKQFEFCTQAVEKPVFPARAIAGQEIDLDGLAHALKGRITVPAIVGDLECE